MILKKASNIKKISKNGKSIFLAYDQGLEHGPIDFNDINVNPNYIIDIAKKGGYTGIIFQKGIAEKYHSEIKKSKVPLILKLNGKTSLVKGDPISLKLATINDAIKLRAAAVGYTIYIGSIHESKMLSELEEIQTEAHKKGLPVIAWIYPRGEGTKQKDPKELMAYAARVALELGVDFVKIHPVGKIKDFKWAKESAGKVRVLAAGGSKTNEKQLLKQIDDYMQSGFSGLAIGRNVWQSKNPIELTEKIKNIIWGGK